MKKQRLHKVIKMYKKKKVNTSLYIHRSNKCAMLYPLPSDKYKTKGLLIGEMEAGREGRRRHRWRGIRSAAIAMSPLCRGSQG